MVAKPLLFGIKRFKRQIGVIGIVSALFVITFIIYTLIFSQEPAQAIMNGAEPTTIRFPCGNIDICRALQ